MPRRLPQPDLRVPSSERLGELIGHLTEGLVGPNGQTLSGAANLALDLSCIDIPARPEELQRLLGASLDENRHLTAHVLRLEAELRKSSAELGKLRGELHGAVHDALTDPLTGLANRRAFDLELGALGARASSSSPAHLVMVDIDHFKPVNDAHGHDTGDQILRIVGQVLLANVRRDSLVARLGGDEFGLLLPGGRLALCRRGRHPSVPGPRVPPHRPARPPRGQRADDALDRDGRLAGGRQQCRMVCPRRRGALPGEAKRPQLGRARSPPADHLSGLLQRRPKRHCPGD